LKRAAIELETIVKIVIVLFALILIIMFITGNFQGIGAGITNVSHNVTERAPSVTDRIINFNISSS
jgi:hypothetical protein